VPAYHLSCTSPGHDAEFSNTVYSDDFGKTWSASDGFGAYTSEGAVVELFDSPPGTLRWNARVDGPINCTGPWGHLKHCRATALSSDGGETWGMMQPTDIPDPMCKGSIVRWPSAKAFVLSNVFSVSARGNLSVSLSRNNGASFDSHAVVFSGASGYSALDVSDDGIATVLFERGGKHPGKPGFGNYELCMISAGILDLKPLL
jgi:hypothetical protein